MINYYRNGFSVQNFKSLYLYFQINQRISITHQYV